MKTTVEVRDELFRRTKAVAAMRGETLKEFISTAIEDRLERVTTQQTQKNGWRRAFGRATQEQVEEVDAIMVGEFDRIDPEEWR